MRAIRGRYSRRRSIRFDLRAVRVESTDYINTLEIYAFAPMGAMRSVFCGVLLHHETVRVTLLESYG